MKVIDFNAILKTNISPIECYNWTSEMIKNKANTLLPPKINMKPFDGVFCNVMPSIISDTGVLIVPIHTPGFTNCDLFFDKVFADEYGDFMQVPPPEKQKNHCPDILVFPNEYKN